MTTVRDELRGLVAALRGALEWHREGGDAALPVPPGYQVPALGRIAARPRPRPVAPPRRPESPMPAPASAPAPAPAPPPIAAPPPAPVEGDAARRAAALQALRDEIGDCARCQLCSGRTELVFGAGRPDARLMFVGDAPDEAADETGLPYADEAGRLLGRMIRAMGLRREEVYLTYVVKCRPDRRDPTTEEVAACRDFLRRQVATVRPEMIVALGEEAARHLTGSTQGVAWLRKQALDFDGVPVAATFPPVALIQNPGLKGQVWEDLKRVMRRLDLKPPARR